MKTTLQHGCYENFKLSVFSVTEKSTHSYQISTKAIYRRHVGNFTHSLQIV